MAAPLVAFSEEMRQNDRALRSFLFARMYRHYKVNRMTSKARGVVRALFDHYLARPDCLPDEWQQQAPDLPEAALARLVADSVPACPPATHGRRAGRERRCRTVD